MSTKMWIKNKVQIAREAVNQDKAIDQCIYCKPLKDMIAAHHPNPHNLASTSVTIAKCPECRKLIYSITQCARQGHIKVIK